MTDPKEDPTLKATIIHSKRVRYTWLLLVLAVVVFMCAIVLLA